MKRTAKGEVSLVVRLPAELHRRATRLAARDERSLNATIIIALRRLLEERKEAPHGAA